MEENKKVLEIEDLSVEYVSNNTVVKAVNGISLTLEKGKTVGLVGETGAGKTTTALAAMALLPERVGKITSGVIRLMGDDISTMTEKQINAVRGEIISMIFQDPMTALNPIMPVGKQIEESLRLHNTQNRSKEELHKRVDEVLEMVGIPAARRGDYPMQFSGGMKQRVVIAIALACQPEILIADEPTTALDVTIQAQVLELIEEMQKRLGMAMIMITHDLGIVVRNCDDVAIMYAGQIVEYGTVEQIFTPGGHHPYTEGLFGSIPKLRSGERRLVPIEGLMPDPTDLPKGCKFSPRCSKCMGICREREPEETVHNGHRVKCFLFSEEGKAHE